MNTNNTLRKLIELGALNHDTKKYNEYSMLNLHFNLFVSRKICKIFFHSNHKTSTNLPFCQLKNEKKNYF